MTTERIWRIPLDAAAWSPVAAGEAQLALSSASVGERPALRMDFDFKRGTGFVVARCPVQHDFREDYAVTFRLRGAGRTNDLEIKFVDSTGQNVWRHVQKRLRPPARWKRFRIDSSAVEFAWGPASGEVPKDLGAIELAIVAGEGGAGTLWLSDLAIEHYRALDDGARASASSGLPGFEADRALGGSGWMPSPDDARPWITVDFTETRRLGGLVIDWRDGAPASGFRVRASARGRRWRTVHEATRAGGARSYLYLPSLKTRFLGLELNAPSAGATLHPQSFEFSRSIETFWYGIARRELRGWYPRWLHREQTLWTPIGIPDGTHCALMNEEGAVEIAPGSFSIEPMLAIDGRLYTWADVVQRQELLDGMLPVPSAIWEAEAWLLRIQGEAAESGLVRLRYRVENRTDRSLSVRLLVLVRPFQVTPPWQRVDNIGGVSFIHDLVWEAGALQVNGTAAVVPASAASGFTATTFDEGFVAMYLAAAGEESVDERVHDALGLASGALAFDVTLEPRATAERIVECLPNALLEVGQPAFDWTTELPAAQWSGSGWAMDAIHAALTAIAHILVTRSGPALQPGPRRYARSWIRDGTIMGAALLRMGHAKEVAEFIRWYAPYQRSDGFVPCCVDRNGPDWLVEHDSHGQLIAAIADCYRFTADARFLEKCWPFVVKAVGCIERLLEDDGLLPVSVSHEGYLAQPVHSYWDDFWALRGLRDAVDIARTIADGDAAARWSVVAERVASALFASIERTRAMHELDFIPGSIEWADFDPTATAIAIAHLDVAEGLDRRAVERTFDRYVSDWRRRRSGALAWTNYSPYEMRIIGALVRLGRREDALELLRFFLSDRRPPAWNQWPEIAWRDHRAPAHVGDLPHTWVAAEYVLAVRSLFAYERVDERKLVLAAGLAAEWTSGTGVQVQEMPTLYGALSYSMRAVDERTLRCDIGSGVAADIELRPPLSGRLLGVSVNGRAHDAFDAQSVFISSTPVEVVCHTAGSPRSQ